jgi:hypothetical protein
MSLPGTADCLSLGLPRTVLKEAFAPLLLFVSWELMEPFMPGQGTRLAVRKLRG